MRHLIKRLRQRRGTKVTLALVQRHAELVAEYHRMRDLAHQEWEGAA